MNTQLIIMKAISSSIIEYAENNPDALGEAALGALKNLDNRLGVLFFQHQSTKRGRVETKRGLDLASDDLRRAVVQSRKALEAYAVGERKAPLTPKATAGMWLTSRIYNVAVKHQEALAGVAGDPVVDKAAEKLAAAMDGFSAALSEFNAQQVSWKNLGQALDDELPTIAGKLVGYKQFAMYNMPRTQRRNLRDQIRSVVQSRNGHKKDADAATTTAADGSAPSKPIAFPAVPTVPIATNVPPSSEHPVMSATA